MIQVGYTQKPVSEDTFATDVIHGTFTTREEADASLAALRVAKEGDDTISEFFFAALHDGVSTKTGFVDPIF